jgi:hypothetical protein
MLLVFRIIRFASQCKFVNPKLLYITYLYYHLFVLLNSLLMPHNTQYDQQKKSMPRDKQKDCCMRRNSDLTSAILINFYISYHANAV